MTEDRRLRPPEEHEQFLDRLIKDGIFETKHAALMCAAALGYYRNEHRPLAKAGEGIRWQIFERNQDSAFIYALAISVEKNINVLEPGTKDRIAEIFEEYAAGGLDAMQRTLAQSGEPLDSLLLLLAEARRATTEAPVGLEGLTPGALDILGI